MTSTEQLLLTAGSVITGGMSLYAALKKIAVQKKKVELSGVRDHAELIFDGYSQIVEELRGEVTRLNNVIADLRDNQEECERRNEEMARIVLELRQRVADLEDRRA